MSAACCIAKTSVVMLLLQDPYSTVTKLLSSAVTCKSYCFCRSVMAESQLSAVLTAACLVLIFIVRKLGLVMSQRESLTTSQQAMLKQVWVSSTSGILETVCCCDANDASSNACDGLLACDGLVAREQIFQVCSQFLQVEGLRNEYNRVTSSQSKADTAAGSKLDSSADSSQLKQLQVMPGLSCLLHLLQL